MCVMVARTAVPWEDTGSRGDGGGAEAFCLLLGAPSLLQQAGPQSRRGRKEPNWRQSSFLAVGPPLEASVLLRRRISEGAL